MKIVFVLIFFAVSNALTLAQTPVLAPLDHNPALLNRKPAMLKNSISIEVDTFSFLKDGAFFDDFSYYWRSTQPDKKYWIDDNVFINNHFPVLPRSNGVATFDGLDAFGAVYQNSAPTFPADTLTSVPIDLEGQTDMWLSFFYQPQGAGDNPQLGDSLILQFKKPTVEDNPEEWRSVWRTPGTTVHPFRQVFIHVDSVDNSFLYKGFQFRFVNYVSLDADRFNPGKRGGSVDHWHLDYVRLEANRISHVATQDIAVIAPMKSLIRGYRTIPLNQVPAAISTRLEPMIEITYRNNDTRDHPVPEVVFATTDVYNNITTNLPPGRPIDIPAGETYTFRQTIFNPFQSISVASVSVDSALFELRGFLRTNDPEVHKRNDTVRFNQFFGDYFARDDGNPESGYGFIGFNAQGCAIACRYESFIPQPVILNAVRIYFNQTANDPNVAAYRFRIAVWEDDNGRPGERIYMTEGDEYRLTPDRKGRFNHFELGQPVLVGRNYWIGVVQVTTGFLNIGYDLNHNDRGNLWYNNGIWHEDINSGTLMIRPVFNQSSDLVSSTCDLPAVDFGLKIFPNPASHQIRVEINDISSDFQIGIYDVVGRLLYSAPYSNEYLDVSAFAEGLYFVRLTNVKTGMWQTEKMLVKKN